MQSKALGEGGRRLRLHRETLRALSDDELGRAAGGQYIGDLYLTIQPKTNGWSSQLDALCA